MTLFSGVCTTRSRTSSEDTQAVANRSSWALHHVNSIAQQFHSGIQQTINRNWLTKSQRLYPSRCSLYEALRDPRGP